LRRRKQISATSWKKKSNFLELYYWVVLKLYNDFALFIRFFEFFLLCCINFADQDFKRYRSKYVPHLEYLAISQRWMIVYCPCFSAWLY
jgi:hypothetical protein